MRKLNQAGITITELIISIGIAGVLTSSLLIVSLGFFADTIRGQVTSEMIVSSHFALRAMTEDLRLGNAIRLANTISDVNGPTGGWITSDEENVLVIATPAVTDNNQIIYNEATGDPFHNELIYFLQDGVLYKRLLSNNAAIGNSIRTTCPKTTVSSTCPADLEYTSHVNDLGLKFYDLNNAETNNPALARSVKVDLPVSRQVFGKTVTHHNSILVKLRN